MDKFLELDNLIFTSALPLEDKYRLSEICRKLDLKKITTLTKLFKERPEWIFKFHKNIQAKKKALEGKDKKAWNKIIKKENLDLSEIEMKDIG